MYPHRGKSRHSDVILQGKYSRLISPASSSAGGRKGERRRRRRPDPRTDGFKDVIISTSCGRIKYLSVANVARLSRAGGSNSAPLPGSREKNARPLRRIFLQRANVAVLGRVSLGTYEPYLVPEERRPRKTVRQLRGFVGFTRRRSHRRVCLLVEIRQDARFTGDVNGTPASANRPPRRWFMVWLFG